MTDKMMKSKIKREAKRLRKRAVLMIVVCATVACSMLLFISIQLFINGAFFRGVKEVSAEVERVNVNIPALSNTMQENLLKAGFDLFKVNIHNEGNVMMAPYATLMAMGTLQNGASGATLSEMQKVLKGMSLADVNNGYAALNKKLQKTGETPFEIKNSIWLKRGEDFTPTDYFLKANATYYGADLMMADFSKKYTLKKMEEWLKINTGNKRSGQAEVLDAQSAIVLMSTSNFASTWEVPYEKGSVLGGNFKLKEGKTKETKYIYSKENYLQTKEVEGFIKPYAGGKLSFVAIRPIGDLSIYEYIRNLESEAFQDIIQSKSTQQAIVGLPKFTYESRISLKEGLNALGVALAFEADEADFSKLFATNRTRLYLTQVLQHHVIQVDENGTSVNRDVVGDITEKSTHKQETETTIVMDSPFLYAIIDNETKLPLIMGIVAEPN